MSAGPSLRLRALVGAVVWVVVALGAGGAVLMELFRDHVEAQARADLAAHMDQLVAGLARDPQGRLAAVRELSDPRFRKPYSGLYWQVTEQGQPASRSRSLWDADLPVPVDDIADGAFHIHRIVGPQGEPLLALERAVTVEAPARVTVAIDAAVPNRAVSEFRRQLSLAFVVLGSLLIVAAIGQAAFVLKPLGTLRRRLGDVRAGAVARLGGTFPAEIQPLADDLNGLLDHNAALIERARSQAADLAHGLKTPLAVISGEAVACPPENATVVREQVELMQRRVESHLARARAAAARDVPGLQAELSPCAERLVRTIARLYPAAISVDAEGVFKGDARDLEEMLGNLLDNAGKWAAGQIQVRGRVSGAQLVVTIDDDGPGIPPGAAADAFVRGRRLDETRPGTGLGLAITRDLAEMYGGTVLLETSPLGGCRATLTLPAVMI